MRFIKGFFVLCLCVLLGTCFPDDGVLEIDIGDYEAQLASWNSQNMLDYQLSIKESEAATGLRNEAVISVKNGIPESSDPPSWLEEGRLSTIPELYSYIKKEEKRMRDKPKNKYDRASFKVSYDTEYHYPKYISEHESHGSADGAWWRTEWQITLTPLGEE
jgi:hypothetical protein